jgi:imidazoleglycerol phosphate dehydratase HisB
LTPDAADAFVTITVQMLRHPDRHASESVVKGLARAVRSDSAKGRA